jgi:hypothetical protein
MLMAHMYEALSIIEDIQQGAKLRDAVQQCEGKTRSSFDAVAAFLRTDDYKMLLRIRNNVSFHYDSRLAVGRWSKSASVSRTIASRTRSAMIHWIGISS